MNRFLPLLVLGLTLGACETDTNTTMANPPAPQPAETSESAQTIPAPMAEGASEEVVAQMQNGVQTAEVTVGRMGYVPGQVQLKAGVPARLTFTRTVESSCAEQIQVPAFGVAKTDLPLNEPTVIEFTPTEAGDYQFVCGMDMMKGALVVKA